MSRFRTLSAASAAALVSFSLLLAAPAAAALSPTTAVMATDAAATGTVEWSVVPASADGADGRISLRHAADPGATIADAIEVQNTGDAPSTFEVRAGDGVVGAKGAFDIASGDAEDAGSWVQIAGLDDGTLTLAAGESRVLPVTIAVPADAVPGDHPAGIVVGLRQSADGVTVTHRVGVRLHLQVTGELTPALEIVATEASFEPSLIPFVPGTARVTYTLENAGNVRFGAASLAELAGPFGASAASSPADLAELLPGDSVTQTVEVEVLPLVWLTGALEVTPTTIGEDAVPLPAAAAVDLSAAAVSWTTLALVILIVGGVVLVVVIRRRRRAASLSAPSESSSAAAPV